MWFWNKKDMLMDKLIDLVKIQGAKLSTVEKEVELINGKLRKRIYKEPEPDEEDLIQEPESPSDGFDDLRKLRKTL